MVAIGIIDLVGHSGNLAEVLAVATGKLAGQTLGGCCQDAVVVLIALAELVDAVTHVGNNLDTQLLRLVALAMMMPREGNQTLGQADETDAERSLVDDALDLVVGRKLTGTVPQLRHEQGELLGHSGLLVLVAGIKLTGRNFQHVV